VSDGEMERKSDERSAERVRPRKKLVRRHTDLDVYQRAFNAAMRVFELSREFPAEERYSMTDQIRRASRSVCANVAEGWRKRRYEAALISKLSDAEGEGAETQAWLQFGVGCGYLDRDAAAKLYAEYDAIIAMLVDMIVHAESWVL